MTGRSETDFFTQYEAAKSRGFATCSHKCQDRPDVFHYLYMTGDYVTDIVYYEKRIVAAEFTEKLSRRLN